MISTRCPRCAKMRGDHGICETCLPFLGCGPCADPTSKELHICGAAVAFPAEADTLASSPNAIAVTRVRRLHILPEEGDPSSLRGTEAAEGKGIMERAFKIGCSVIFFDSHRQPHEALVTNWFHGGQDGETVASVQQRYDEAAEKRGVAKAPVHMPCCNLVYVSTDTSKGDTYGRQIERQTSCQYGGQMYVPYTGMCWCWPDEFEQANELAAKAFAEAVAK